MGLTWFEGMVGAIMGYLGYPKVGNTAHVLFFTLMLYRALQRDWQELGS